MRYRVCLIVIAISLVTTRKFASTAEPLSQAFHGLHGYVTVSVQEPPQEYMYGYGFYSTAFALLKQPLQGFQAGLAGTWILPDNRDFKYPLCPPGTYARDNWPERGPVYQDVFQTIEGSLGFWASTQFGTTWPKYRMNGTTDGYTQENSSPGWGFGVTEATPDSLLAIAQLSNRLLVPPDGFTLKEEERSALMGIAWMVLPLVPGERTAAYSTGNQSWTFFANTENFAGPVAFWIPDAFSRLSKRYHVINARGLDSRPGLMGAVGMEIASVPCFEARDKQGTLYRRIPELSFPTNPRGQTILTQNVNCYSKQALYDAMVRYHQQGVLPSGEFSQTGTFQAKLKLSKAEFDQGENSLPIDGLDQYFKESLFRTNAGLGYGLKWNEGVKPGNFPEYFKELKGKMIPVDVSQVPPDLRLQEQEFEKSSSTSAYRKSDDEGSAWNSPGPAAGPFLAHLNDGSVVHYSWYRFCDQPSIVAQKWSRQKRERLQKLIEKMHVEWTTSATYIPPPSGSKKLIAFDDALLVTPPTGLEVGYVPIVVSQVPLKVDKVPGKKKRSMKRKSPQAAAND